MKSYRIDFNGFDPHILKWIAQAVARIAHIASRTRWGTADQRRNLSDLADAFYTGSRVVFEEAGLDPDEEWQSGNDLRFE